MSDYLTYIYLLAMAYTFGLAEADKWQLLFLRVKLGL